MDSITIISYESVGPIRFKDTTEDVVLSCGTPNTTTAARNGDFIHHYNWGLVRFSHEKGTVQEITLFSNTKPVIHGIDLFNDREALQKITKLEKNLYEFVGFLFLLDLGISLSGFHKEESERVVAAFSKGAADHLKPKFARYEL
ncbi:hypothetical protein KP004_03655 [Geomonas oryzisoli]|uniref:Uncharacterized protein n=1 Tax=Geomonas oryzisoli TaxID=2847992 RepID=A0ABX8JB37_9BACT|nr:hypothetical protein [Geomonas oryzisoli]QWV94291.1 hypothetical protein KP004_03655 [Geomonas oryzisoli]